MSTPQATSSLTDRLAALAARTVPASDGAPAADLAVAGRVEELVEQSEELRAEVAGLRASGDAQSAAVERVERRLASVEGQLDQLGQTLRAESARLEAALGQRVEEAALALAETLLGGGAAGS